MDDYAAYIFAMLSLYKATLHREYLKLAGRFCGKAISDFGDNTGGFYLYGNNSEELILRPKETYDGAIPSGNSLMAYNLVRLSLITSDEKYKITAEQQLNFLASKAQYLPGYAMFLTALLEYDEPPMKVTVVLDEQADSNNIPLAVPLDAAVSLLPQPTEEYPLKNGKTTYYVCKGHSCMPATNDLNEIQN